MGKISERLKRRLTGGERLPGMAAAKRRHGKQILASASIQDIQTLVNDGYDPIHAAYLSLQQLTSYFAEHVSALPEMESYARTVLAAEQEYLPDYPPMSPVTQSYFTTWAFYDLRIGRTDDTIGACLLDLNDLVRLNPDQLVALKRLSESRMGIYEHVGAEEGRVQLKELLTDKEFSCHCGSGYLGQPGELWYVRLLPPLLPALADYRVVFTTPYVLLAPKDDWLQFLNRSLSKWPGVDRENQLRRLLKDGPTPNFWNAFVLAAYHHHQNNAIYLAGVPDLRATLPHAP